jgi:hypothetical protein
MHLYIPLSAWLGLMLVASPSFGQAAFPDLPDPPAAPDPPDPGQQPGGQPPPEQPGGQPLPQQPGQWQQQPGQWQQPGWQQQPWQQPGQWQQQPGPWQQPARPVAPPRAQREPETKQLEFSIGLKLLAGGNLWTEPDAVDPGYDALGFAGNGGGFGWGAALYLEARIAQYFGLELDFGYDHSTLQRDLAYSVNGVPFTVNETVSSSGVRWGLLVKGIAPVTFGRVWLGIGPERVSGSSVDGKVEITRGSPSDSLRSELESSIRAKRKYSTMLSMAFGVAIEIGDHFEIPFELRAAKNLSQDSDWKERVDTSQLFATPPRYEVTVQSSWDFRLATGLGYRF